MAKASKVMRVSGMEERLLSIVRFVFGEGESREDAAQVLASLAWSFADARDGGAVRKDQVKVHRAFQRARLAELWQIRAELLRRRALEVGGA